MSVGGDLRTFLLADATLSGLIGTRLYPLKMPQKPTYPAITYQWVTGQRVHSTDGASGLAGPRVQFDCWAETYLAMESVFEALRLRLDGYQGAAGTTKVQGAFFDNERDLYEDKVEIYRRSVDYFIWHSESV